MTKFSPSSWTDWQSSVRCVDTLCTSLCHTANMAQYFHVTGVSQRRKELLGEQIMTVNKKHQFISPLACLCACK